jgi:hypothetical protein
MGRINLEDIKKYVGSKKFIIKIAKFSPTSFAILGLQLYKTKLPKNFSLDKRRK